MTRYNEVLYNVMKYKRYGSMETKRSEEYILEYLFHDIVVYGFQFSNLFRKFGRKKKNSSKFISMEKLIKQGYLII